MDKKGKPAKKAKQKSATPIPNPPGWVAQNLKDGGVKHAPSSTQDRKPIVRGSARGR